MIKANDGCIELNGDITDITSDVAGVLHAYRNAIEDNFDEDTANKCFALVGRMAAMPHPREASEEERRELERYGEDFAEIIHEAAQRKRGRR